MSARRLGRVLTWLVIAAACVLAPAAPAAAAVGGGVHAAFGLPDCKNPPAVTEPDNGATSIIDSGPETPRTGDPFAPSGPTLYEVYGWSGYTWPNYDPGCSSSVTGGISDPTASSAGWVANMALATITFLGSVLAAVVRFCFNPTALALLDPVLRLGAAAFGQNIFLPLIGITTLITAVWLASRAWRGDIASSAQGAGWVLVVVAGAVACLTWPTTVAPRVDSVVTGAIGSVNSILATPAGNGTDDAATAVAANLTRSVAFETWKSGMFGRIDSPTADKYAPRLYEDSTLSRAEAALPDAQKQKVIEDKQADFKATAQKVQDEDPAAYEYLAGNQNIGRIWIGLLGIFAMTVCTWFLVFASLMLLIALITVRLAIILFPLLAVIGAYPPMRVKLTGLLDYVAGKVVGAVLFGCLSAVFIAAVGGVLSPAANVNPFVAALLLLAMSIAAWRISKPIRGIRGLSRFSRSHGGTRRDPQNPDSDPNANPLTNPVPDEDVVPTEAASPSVFEGAAKGAFVGAGSSAVLGVVSGGGVSVATMAAGAARGAAAGGGGAAVARLTGSPIAGAVAGLGIGMAAERAYEARHAATGEAPTADTATAVPPQVEAGPTTRPVAAIGTAPAAATTTGTAAPEASAPNDFAEYPGVYMPGEGPADVDLREAKQSTTTGAWDIYTPEETL